MRAAARADFAAAVEPAQHLDLGLVEDVWPAEPAARHLGQRQLQLRILPPQRPGEMSAAEVQRLSSLAIPPGVNLTVTAQPHDLLSLKGAEAARMAAGFYALYTLNTLHTLYALGSTK